MITPDDADLIFRALGDATRRDILARTLREPLSVSELAPRYDMSFTAVRKHVAVLERAGLVAKRTLGRRRIVHAEPAKLRQTSQLLGTCGQTEEMDATLAALPADADHRTAERAFTDAGWTRAGAGDWAIALRAPDGSAAARISPFDPTGSYTAELYRGAAHTRMVPELFAHRRLSGGGDLQLMEWLTPVDESDARGLHGLITERDESVAELVALIDGIHARALRELPWCGPLDTNPSNVMRGADGRLVVTDLFYADGPALYSTAGSDPDLLVSRIPEPERRFLTEIPLAASGPWDRASREEMRRGIAMADARRT